MAIHYKFTDSRGQTHTRTSRGHISPQFTHGVVFAGSSAPRPSFCGSQALAEKEAASRRNYHPGAVTEICAVFVSDRPFPEQAEAKRKRADAARADLAQLRSEEESERRGLAMMSGDLEG